MKLRNKYIFLLLLFIPVAFMLRIYFLPSHLFFGPEQGRDFLVIKDIVVNHKFTLIGPKTDIDGIFHGPLFYYLSAIPFLIFHGDPFLVLLFLILFHSLTVFVLYFLSEELFSDKFLSSVSIVLFTFSYGAIVDSRWLSNPPMTIPLSALLYFFLIKFIKGKKYYLIPAGITYALLGQVEFLNYFFFAFITSFSLLIYYRNILRNKLLTVISLVIAVFFACINFLFFDLRHDFLISKSLMNLLKGSVGYYISFKESLISSITLFIDTFSFYTGVPYIIAVIILMILLPLLIRMFFKARKYGLILIWLFIPLFLLILLKHQVLRHFYILITIPAILSLSFLISSIRKKSLFLSLIIILLIIVRNLTLLESNLPHNRNVYFQSTQPELLYKDQLSVIDNIYKNA
ncbi:MAG: hypothetical protein UT63_C0066G0001, partial [Candidatus Gottesmanbacteria bacterium GW2011_GWC2_39_8]